MVEAAAGESGLPPTADRLRADELFDSGPGASNKG